MRKLGVALIPLMLCGSDAKAVTLLGHSDANSCGVWTADHRSDSIRAVQLNSWLLGFLSGWADTLSVLPSAVVTSNDPLAGTNPTAVEEWIGTYCSQHPLDSLTHAIRQLEEELARRQKPN
jgi:hypothetical protein